MKELIIFALGMAFGGAVCLIMLYYSIKNDNF